MKKIRLLMVGAMVALFTLISAQTATASTWIGLIGHIDGSWNGGGTWVEVTNNTSSVASWDITIEETNKDVGYFHFDANIDNGGNFSIGASENGTEIEAIPNNAYQAHSGHNANWHVKKGTYNVVFDFSNYNMAIKESDRVPDELYIIGNKEAWSTTANATLAKSTDEYSNIIYSGIVELTSQAWTIAEKQGAWGAINCFRHQIDANTTTIVNDGISYDLKDYSGNDANIKAETAGKYLVTVDWTNKKITLAKLRITSDTEYTAPVNYADGITLTVAEGVKVTYPTTQAKLPNVVLENGAEIKATGVTSVESLAIIKTFDYGTVTNPNKMWFSLGLPFEATASNNQIWKLEDDGTYAVAEANTDFATFDYNGEKRFNEGATGRNWDILLANNDNVGEVIQFPTAKKHTFKFVAANSDAALDALTIGRDGNKFFNDATGDDDDNGWNVVPAGKTYSTSYTDKIAGVAIAQVFDGTTGSFKTGEVNATYTPGTVFTIQLTEQSTDYISTNSESDAEVETYEFKLIDSDGNVIDRIYLFDGSNQAQYRVGKMGAFSASAPQMCIQANNKSYCAYSSLASEADKSYTVSFANIPEGSKLVMTKAGAQSVTVDDAATTLDTAVDVADGNMNITIGSQTTSVGDAAATAKVYGVDGAIIIEGANGAYSIVNMSGVAVAAGNVAGNTAVNLPAGIYVVNAAGEYSKVIVK